VDDNLEDREKTIQQENNRIAEMFEQFELLEQGICPI